MYDKIVLISGMTRARLRGRDNGISETQRFELKRNVYLSDS